MIDKDEAERIALRYLNPDLPLGEGRFGITKTIEKSFGWIFYYDSRDSPDNLLGNHPFVVDRVHGELTPLPVDFEPVENKFVWLEKEYQWRIEYDAALDFIKQEKYAEAEQRLHVCLAKFKELVPHCSAGLNLYTANRLGVSCMSSLGELKLRSGQTAEAESMFWECKRLLDEESPAKKSAKQPLRVQILQQLIALCIGRMRFQEADALRRELAIAYRAAEDYSKTQEILSQQLQKRLQIYPQGHPAMAQTLTDLATMKISLEQFFEAQLFLKAAMDIWDPVLKNEDLLKSYCPVGSTFTLAQLQKCAAETMKEYAYVLKHQGQSQEAEQLMLKAKQMAI